MPLQGVANKIRDVQILGIPLGEATVGFGAGIFVSEVTDGLLAPKLPAAVPVVAIKFGEAYAMSRWGHKVIGSGGARMATVVLTYNAIRAVLPIDTYIRDFVQKLLGYIPNAEGAGAGSFQTNPNPGDGGGGGGDAMSVLYGHLVAQGGGQ